MYELKKMEIWLCWNYETNKGGRLTKVPYSATGRRTGSSEKYQDTWVTYDQAVKAAEERGYTGVGFVIPPGYAGIDVDRKGKDDPDSVTILEKMDTYAEHSPSKTGMHLVFKCEIDKIPQSDGKLDPKYYSKNPKNGLEVYFGGLTNRFFTFTGDVIADKPLADRTEEAKWFLDNYMLKSGPSSDSDIVKAMRKAKNGSTFTALFDEGDTSGYKSESEADLALCNILAFNTGNDAERIDRLFRQSKLYRAKWDRKGYRESTIEKSIAGCNGKYNAAAKELPPYIDIKTGKPKVICPLLARHVRENLNYFIVRDRVRGGARYYVYEGGVYISCPDDMLRGIIKKYIEDYDETFANTRDIREVLGLLTTDLKYREDSELNADEDIINFQNGILDLETMELLPHSPDILSTVQIPCNWPGRPLPTPLFDEVMSDLTEGKKDIENLLLQFMGVCISVVKGYRMKKALFMVGPGDTGKSLLKSLTEKLLGKGNYVGIELDELEARFGTSAIYGKRLAGSSDMKFKKISELNAFKKCTGGDSLFAEFKGKDSFEFVFHGLLWFCMNKLPVFAGDNGQWVYNRIMVVECNNVIPPDKQDKLLLEKMYEEREGIVYKLVMALKEVIANGYNFSEPESVVARRAKYMVQNSSDVLFFNECMEERNPNNDEYYTITNVHQAYSSWCSDTNRGNPKTLKEFKQGIADHLGIPPQALTDRTSNGIVFLKYTLTDEAKKRYLGDPRNNVSLPPDE